MENPDVVLEVAEEGKAKMQLSYKVYSRDKDDSKAAIEFIQIIHELFGCVNCEEDGE